MCKDVIYEDVTPEMQRISLADMEPPESHCDRCGKDCTGNNTSFAFINFEHEHNDLNLCMPCVSCVIRVLLNHIFTKDNVDDYDSLKKSILDGIMKK